MTLVMIAVFSLYVFIYVRNSYINLIFWGDLFTLLAFLLLFIGSGKEVCAQKELEIEKIQEK